MHWLLDTPIFVYKGAGGGGGGGVGGQIIWLFVCFPAHQSPSEKGSTRKGKMCWCMVNRVHIYEHSAATYLGGQCPLFS